MGDMVLRAGSGDLENCVENGREAENFTAAAAHLLRSWRRTGSAPGEVVKIFA
ncbi:hypothetical protein [Actinacidiphila sp. ITFR-21]|uniref:hypothetical protein n=1 Tax=Actinacidiphila sp. ITFR-21 TaxID=3075199 RepID=UPI00288BF0C6|nr:hypothetical protein [Streptomyces sp. ITFR-21]WNI16565.1 hypothetical protein RLT57_14295 [Streptomyces sp. ITFR-21]